MERLDIQDYIRPLLKWWWLLLVSVMIAAAASYFYTVRQPRVYSAQSTIMVGNPVGKATPDQNEIFLSQLLAENYADIAMRDTVRQATMSALDMTWLPFYWVQALPNSPIIEVTVSSEIPEISRDVANEVVNQLILQGPDGQGGQENQQFITERLDKLKIDIEETEAEIERSREELAGLFSAREISALQDDITVLEEKLAALNSDYLDLLDRTLIESPNTINIIEKASLPPFPDPSNLWLNVILASAVGFVLAAGGAYVLEYLDDTVKTSEDVKRQFGLTTLTAIPAIAESKSNVLSGNVAIDDSKLVMMTNPQSPYAEAFRILRTNLQFADVDRRYRHILVTSPEPGDGKSTTIANLGMALAQAGKRVVIVDADLHRPTQHQIFKLPNNMGVTTALFGDVRNVSQMIHPTRTPGLSVLTSGPLPPNPSELLGSDLMAHMLATLDQAADIILLDTPPATILVDAAALSMQADAVVLVVRAGKTSRNTAKQAVEGLRQVRANIAGVILNGVSVQNSGFNYNYSQYGYNRAGQSAPVGRPPMMGNPPPMQPSGQPQMAHPSQPTVQSGQMSPAAGYGPSPVPNAPNWQSRPSDQYSAGPHAQPNVSDNQSASARPASPYVAREPSQPPRGQTPSRGGQATSSGAPQYRPRQSSSGPTQVTPNYRHPPAQGNGVSVNNYGRVQIPTQQKSSKKGLGRFWRS